MVLPVIYELISSLVPLAGKSHSVIFFFFLHISALCKFKLQRLMASIQEDSGSIPGLAQWVKGLAWPRALA